MLEIIIFLLLIILVTYTLFAGADLGTGILEIFLSKREPTAQESFSTHALKPVWEINHIWLGLATIIFFIVFPKAFYHIFTLFMFPVLFLFVGLFIRGFAFSLKSLPQYEHNKNINKVFDFSSLWSTFWLGNFVGSLILGKTYLNPENFYAGYIAPWLGVFPILTGLFLIGLFSFIAAIFLYTETNEKILKESLKKRAIIANIYAIIVGAIILVYAFFQNDGITFYFLQSKLSLISFALATILLIPTYLFMQNNKKTILRISAMGQIICILLGLFGAQFPIIFQTNKDNPPKTFTFYNTVAEQGQPATLLGLVILIILITIPSYYYIYRVYRTKMKNKWSK